MPKRKIKKVPSQKRGEKKPRRTRRTVNMPAAFTEKLKAYGILSPIVVAPSREKIAEEIATLTAELASLDEKWKSRRKSADGLSETKMQEEIAKRDGFLARLDEIVERRKILEETDEKVRNKTIHECKRKLALLRKCFIEGATWRDIAFVLAYQLYAGFDVVEKPTKKNRQWTRVDRLNLVKRVRLEIGKGTRQKASYSEVRKAFPEDYGSFSDGTLKARYFESVKFNEAEAKRAENARTQPSSSFSLAGLGEVYRQAQWIETLRNPQLHWTDPKEMDLPLDAEEAPQKDDAQRRDAIDLILAPVITPTKH